MREYTDFSLNCGRRVLILAEQGMVLHFTCSTLSTGEMQQALPPSPRLLPYFELSLYFPVVPGKMKCI